MSAGTAAAQASAGEAGFWWISDFDLSLLAVQG